MSPASIQTGDDVVLDRERTTTTKDRTVIEYDSIEDIKKALKQQVAVDGYNSDWMLQNYDATTTTAYPNHIEDEALRLSVLKSYNILDSATEMEFDAITDECKRYFKCPIAVVSFVDMGRQWFKSVQGHNDKETPRCIAFCAHVVKRSTNTVMVVPDATKDIRFKDGPLVRGGKVAFYAGAPIITPEGQKVGSLCVIDTKPHPEGLSLLQQEMLKTLAQEVVLQMVTRVY